MKIIVLIKQVANKDAILRINPQETWIKEDDISYETNESDGYALEEALRIKEKRGGEVVICTMGPPRVKSVIKDGLARGADRAIHISTRATGASATEEPLHFSPFQTATRLAEALRDENADLILSGLQSDDYGYGQTGVILAELMGFASATIVIEVDASVMDGLRVKRELESGWYQWYQMPLPALLTIQSGISQIRYATLKGIMAAKKREIKEIISTADTAGVTSGQTIARVYLPHKSKETKLLGRGDAKAGAAELAEKLHSDIRII